MPLISGQASHSLTASLAPSQRRTDGENRGSWRSWSHDAIHTASLTTTALVGGGS